MAVPARKPPERSSNGRFLPTDGPIPRDEVRLTAARLYGQGFKRPQIAQALLEHISPSRSLRSARILLAKWEREQEFRDLIWEHAVQKLDMETPQILEGIGKAAKRGRVDAAKLALSVAKRYTDKSEMPTEMTIRLEGVSRPDHRQLNGPSEGEGN
jgi:hypothetical protein